MTLATKLWRAAVFSKRLEKQRHISLLRAKTGMRGNVSRWRAHRIEKHMPLVHQVAKQTARMFPAVPIEDLISCGYLGLIDAADRLDPERQKEFARYAWWRIRGAIVDAHKRQAYREEQHESIQGMSERMGFLPAALQRDTAPLPDEIAEQSEMVRTVALLIAELPEQDAALMRAVMAGASVPEAARALGRSPAWGRARLAAARDRVGAGVILR